MAPSDPDLAVDAGLEPGRTPRLGYTYIPDWVLLSEISPGAKTLYWTLYTHVNTLRKQHGDTLVWTRQDNLLKISGVKSKTTLRKYLHELKAIDAVESRTGRNPRNPLRSQTVYRIHELPRKTYEGPLSLGEFYTSFNSGSDTPALG